LGKAFGIFTFVKIRLSGFQAFVCRAPLFDSVRCVQVLGTGPDKRRK